MNVFLIRRLSEHQLQQGVGVTLLISFSCLRPQKLLDFLINLLTNQQRTEQTVSQKLLSNAALRCCHIYRTGIITGSLYSWKEAQTDR